MANPWVPATASSGATVWSPSQVLLAPAPPVARVGYRGKPATPRLSVTASVAHTGYRGEPATPRLSVTATAHTGWRGEPATPRLSATAPAVHTGWGAPVPRWITPAPPVALTGWRTLITSLIPKARVGYRGEPATPRLSVTATAHTGWSATTSTLRWTIAPPVAPTGWQAPVPPMPVVVYAPAARTGWHAPVPDLFEEFLRPPAAVIGWRGRHPTIVGSVRIVDTLVFWQPDTNASLSAATLPTTAARRSSQQTTFRLHNASDSYTAVTVVVDLVDRSPTATISAAAQYLLSADAITYTATLTLDTLVPGATSPPLYLRRVTPSDAPTGTWPFTLRAQAGSWQ
jgi:hypothetical protein